MTARAQIRRPSRVVIWLCLPLLAAGLSVFDPWISSLVSIDFWHSFGLVGWPYRSVTITVAISITLLLALRLFLAADSFATLSVTLIFVASQLNGLGAGPADLFDVTLFGIFFAWIVRNGMNLQRTVRLSSLFYFASGLTLLALAYLPAMSPVTWFVGMFGIIRITVVAFLLVDLCRDERSLELALRVLVATATISAIIGIIQFTLAYFGIFYFTLIEPAASAFKPTPVGYVMRASGLCRTAQHYSSFLVYALPFALWRASKTRAIKDAAICVTLLAGVAVSLNFGGLFAGLFVIILMPFLRWRSHTIHIALGLLALISIAYFTGILDLVYDLTFGDSGVSKGVDQRKTLFILGLEQFGRSPLIGTGIRGFGNVDGNFWDRPVHNVFGQAAVELGLPGFLIFVAIFFYLSLDLGCLFAKGGTGAKYAGIYLAMLVAAFLISQAEPNLDQSNLWVVFAISQAAILILRGSRATPKGSTRPLP